MRKPLLDVLVCPTCGGQLTLRDCSHSDPETPIVEGTLVCRGCSREYAIRQSVPVLLPHISSAGNAEWTFDFQWRLRFAGKLEEGTWLWGWDLSQLSYQLREVDCWYLDCGCGSGDHARNVALQNPRNQIVGLDRSEAVYYASQRDRDIENLHYVHGDILHPPFRENGFKVLVSVGVWHATGDTRQALLNSIRLLQKDGFMATWLYPNLEDLRRSAEERRFPNLDKSYKAPMRKHYRMWRRYYFFRDYLFLGRGHHLRPDILLILCKLISFALSPFGHIAGFRVPQFRNRFRSNTFILIDNVSPPHQDRPQKEEVFKWFRQAGVNKVVHNLRRGGVYFAVKT